jgi:predicted ABC-type ATPase
LHQFQPLPTDFHEPIRPVIMPDNRPNVMMIAGPNGSGKSTAAPILLADVLGVSEFVNADVIAHGLSAFHPEAAALAAGRIMLARLKELATARQSFSFETTLASRTFAPWISSLMNSGYDFHLLFLWLPSAQFAIERVAQRVRAGGHYVPDDVVRRRYIKGLRNFFSLNQPLATTWRVYNNSLDGPRLIAAGKFLAEELVMDQAAWQSIKGQVA